MQTLDSFVHVFSFFVRSHYNTSYIDNIDKSIRDDTVDENTQLIIENVKEFHTMRHQLCSKIFDYLKNDELLNTLVSASGLEQFDVVPNKSMCCISGVNIPPSHGILLYIHSPTKSSCVTVHKRYKRILYNFWYLVHFSEEIMVDIKTWLCKNPYSCENNVTLVEKIIHHQDKLFIKQGYVKVKNINEYIQCEMSQLPINHSN